jgi:hypothetical protein
LDKETKGLQHKDQMMLHTHIEHCEQIVSNWFSKDFVKYSTKAPFPRHPVLHREQPAQRIETPPKSCDHPLLRNSG